MIQREFEHDRVLYRGDFYYISAVNGRYLLFNRDIHFEYDQNAGRYKGLDLNYRWNMYCVYRIQKGLFEISRICSKKTLDRKSLRSIQIMGKDYSPSLIKKSRFYRSQEYIDMNCKWPFSGDIIVGKNLIEKSPHSKRPRRQSSRPGFSPFFMYKESLLFTFSNGKLLFVKDISREVSKIRICVLHTPDNERCLSLEQIGSCLGVKHLRTNIVSLRDYYEDGYRERLCAEKLSRSLSSHLHCSSKVTIDPIRFNTDSVGNLIT